MHVYPNYLCNCSVEHIVDNAKSDRTILDDLLQNECGGSISESPFSTIHCDLITETKINIDIKTKRRHEARMLLYKYECWGNMCKNHINTSLSVMLNMDNEAG